MKSKTRKSSRVYRSTQIKITEAIRQTSGGIELTFTDSRGNQYEINIPENMIDGLSEAIMLAKQGHMSVIKS